MSNNVTTKASKCLGAMLTGETLTRKKLGDKGLAENNDSLHSYISSLRNRRFIPIESTKNADGTCDYYMRAEEIKRFKNPVRREEQRAEMELVIRREQQERSITLFTNFLQQLAQHPTLWEAWSELPFMIDDIQIMINAMLKTAQKR